jgi:putative transposase
MELINNIPHYSSKEMELAGFATRTLERWNYPIKIKNPKDKREAWYNFNELKPKYQSLIIASQADSKPEPKEPILPLDQYSKKDIELALARYNLVKQYRLAGENAKGSKVQAKQAFVDSVCAGFLLEKEYEITGRHLSFKTLERWDKTMRDGKNTMDDLLPKLREKENDVYLTDAHQQVLKRCYLHKNAPKVTEAIRSAYKIWQTLGIEVPSESKCRRFLVEYTHTDAATCTLIRHGMKAMKDGLMPYIERDPDSIEFLDVLVADGHVLNFQVLNPKTGKPARPTIIGWIDMRTRMIMGWEIMLTENTMSVASSLRQACINSGRICGVEGAVLPRIIYLDNGSSFKNKFFNASVDLESQIGGLFERLKPYGLEDVTYAIPYNARSKVIERAWGCMSEIERMVPTFCGINIDSKPANLHRNEKMAREAYNAYLSENGYPTLQQAYIIVSDWIEEYNARQASGKYLNGYSPLQLAAEQIPTINIEPRLLPGRQLDFLMMHTKIGRLQRNGFNINGTWYYNAIKFPQVAKDDTEYIVKYDILNPEKVLVYHEDGALWCEAGRMIGQGVHAMVKLGSEADRTHLDASMKEQNSVIRDVENAARLEMGMKPKGTRIQKALPEPALALAEKAGDDDYITTGDGRRIKLKYF